MRATTLILALGLGLASCTPGGPLLHPTRSVVEVREVVKVELKEVTFDILEFTVWNNTEKTMVVDRDAILLDTEHGPRRRLPGGVAHSYTLPPGTAHDVNVRYDFCGLRGTTVRVLFDTALTINGKPLDVSPVEIKVL